MKRFLILVLVGGLLLSANAAFACNSKQECIMAGKKAYKAKNYEQAKEYFKKAIQFDPKCEKAWRFYDKTIKKMLMKELNEEEGC